MLEGFLAQRIVTEAEFGSVAAAVREARTWPVTTVLTHYDNRLDNLMIDGDQVTVLDWDHAFAGIGISQELIKLFETEPVSMASPRVAEFLRGYGLADADCGPVLEQASLMLIMDGLTMSYAWAGDPARLDGIRAWLRTISRLSSGDRG